MTPNAGKWFLPNTYSNHGDYMTLYVVHPGTVTDSLTATALYTDNNSYVSGLKVNSSGGPANPVTGYLFRPGITHVKSLDWLRDLGPRLSTHYVVDDGLGSPQSRSYQLQGKPSRKTGGAWRNRHRDGSIVTNPDFRWTAKVTEIARPNTNSLGRVQLSPGFQVGRMNKPDWDHVNRGGLNWFSSSSFSYAGFTMLGCKNSAPTSILRASADTYRSFHDLPSLPAVSESMILNIISTINDRQSVDKGLTTECISEMNSKIYDLANELGELPETIKMVYDLCKKVITGYTTVKRDTRRLTARMLLKNASAADIADATATLWMTYRYGIMPIAYSIADITKAMNAKFGIYQTVRKGRRLSETIDIPRHGIRIENELFARTWMKRQHLVNVPRFDRAVRLNKLTTAWELLPVSFVIDWFANVGDVMSALSEPSYEFNDAMMYSWKNTSHFVIEQPTRTVMVSLTSYRAINITPSQVIGLSFDPFINLKRSLDSMSLGWFAFKGKTK